MLFSIYINLFKLCDDEIRLLTRQEELEKKLNNVQLKNLSLVNTIEVVLTQSERDAELLKKEFNLNDERFCWIKIQTYGKQGNWPQLYDYGKRSNSPIGYEVHHLLTLNHDFLHNKNETYDSMTELSNNSIFSPSSTFVCNITNKKKHDVLLIGLYFHLRLMKNVFHSCSPKFSQYTVL